MCIKVKTRVTTAQSIITNVNKSLYVTISTSLISLLKFSTKKFKISIKIHQIYRIINKRNEMIMYHENRKGEMVWMIYILMRVWN